MRCKLCELPGAGLCEGHITFMSTIKINMIVVPCAKVKIFG